MRSWASILNNQQIPVSASKNLTILHKCQQLFTKTYFILLKYRPLGFLLPMFLVLSMSILVISTYLCIDITRRLLIDFLVLVSIFPWDEKYGEVPNVKRSFTWMALYSFFVGVSPSTTRVYNSTRDMIFGLPRSIPPTFGCTPPQTSVYDTYLYPPWKVFPISCY